MATSAWPWHITVYSTEDMHELTSKVQRAAAAGSDFLDVEAKGLQKRLVRQLEMEGVDERGLFGSQARSNARKVTRQLEHASDLLLDVSRAMALAYRNTQKYIDAPILEARRQRAHPSAAAYRV
jgi:hypothetical protein